MDQRLTCLKIRDKLSLLPPQQHSLENSSNQERKKKKKKDEYRASGLEMSKTHLSGRNTPTCSAHWKVHRRAGTSPYTVTFQDIKSQSNYLPLTSNNPTKRSQNNSLYKGIKNQH